MSTRTVGAFWMILGCFGIAAMTALSKAARFELEAGVIVFIQAATCLAILIPFVWGGPFKTNYPWRHVLRSGGGFLSLFLYVFSLSHIPLIDASLLNQTTPLWAPFVIWAWCRHCPSLKPWPALLLGFLGVIAVLHPDPSSWRWAYLIALASGIALSIALVAMKSLSGRDRPQLMLFYFFSTTAILTLPLLIIFFKPIAMSIFLLTVASGVCYLIGQWGFIRGLAHGPAHAMIPFYFIAVPLSALFDWIFWGVRPDWLSYTGALLIIAGAIWTLLLTRNLPDEITE